MRKKISRSKGVQLTQQRLIPTSMKVTEDSIRSNRGRRAPLLFTAEELRKISGEISGREFSKLDTTRLELMEVDPWNVYAYWHINAPDLARCRARLPKNAQNVRLVLRFTDVSPTQHTANPHEKFDIEVREDSNSWYVNLWRDAKHYSGEIGLRTADGTFETLARSNEIATPRAGPSPDLDFFWVEARTPCLPEPAPAREFQAANDDLLRDLFPQRLPPQDEFPMVEEEVIYPSLDKPAFPFLLEPSEETVPHDLSREAPHSTMEADVRNPAMEPEDKQMPDSFPLLMKSEINHYRRLALKSIKKTMAAGQLPPLAPLPEGMIAPTDVELVSHPLPTFSPGTPSGEMPRISGEDHQEKTGEVDSHPASGGFSTEVGYAEGTEEQSTPNYIALEMLVGKTAFSPASFENSFDMAISLVIDGHCSPNTRLLFFGEPVHLQPDGTFKLHLPLERSPELVELLYRVLRRQGK